MVYEKVATPEASEARLKRSVRFMEYMDGGDLFEAQEEEQFSIYEISRVMKSILRGLEILHNNCLVHQDFALENGLIKKPDGINKYMLGDLGFVQQLVEGKLKGYEGRYHYKAPERFLGIPHDTSADIWAVGVVAHELFGFDDLFAVHHFKKLSDYSSKNLLCTLGSMEERLGQNMSELYFFVLLKVRHYFSTIKRVKH